LVLEFLHFKQKIFSRTIVLSKKIRVETLLKIQNRH
jgi:hypothetical protein